MPASRSLIALLIGTVVFFALWMVALKPSAKSGGTNPSQGVGAYQSAINKAHQAVASSNANDAASGSDNATSRSGATSAASASSSTKTSASKPKAATHSAAARTAPAIPSSGRSSVASELNAVQTAVSQHKVLALLFYNPAAADDQALRQELASVPTHRGQVVKLAIPLSQSGNFTAVTQQVPVNLSPTLVVISRAGDANEDVGYTAPFVISQQVSDALAAG